MSSQFLVDYPMPRLSVQKSKSADAPFLKKSARRNYHVGDYGQIDNGRASGLYMDCGTCESAPTIEVVQPKTVDVTLTITEKAIEMLTDAFGDDRSHALLVGVLSGGCSGYMYDLQIVETTDIDCQELDVSGFRVLVPNASSHLLDGIEVDYVDRLMGGGFKINNPNASSSCGCGESFA
jgi:iron-sulfur cluster assembly protein